MHGFPGEGRGKLCFHSFSMFFVHFLEVCHGIPAVSRCRQIIPLRVVSALASWSSMVERGQGLRRCGLQSVKTAKVVMGLYVGRYYEPLGRQRSPNIPASLGWGSRLAHALGLCTAVPCWNCSASIFDAVLLMRAFA